MQGENQNKLQRILLEGKKKFLKKGYKYASLRNIVKQIGVATGAFYGYYPDKAALFHTLASPAAEELRTLYVNLLKGFDKLPEARKTSGMHDNSEEYPNILFNYVAYQPPVPRSQPLTLCYLLPTWYGASYPHQTSASSAICIADFRQFPKHQLRV